MIKARMIFAVLIVLFLFPCCLKAEEIRFEKDAVLKKISEALPPGWNISESSENIIFERDGTVSVLFENKINAEMSMQKDKDQKEKSRAKLKNAAWSIDANRYGQPRN